MPKPAPEPATEIPPPARDAVAALSAAPRDPVKILVSGGIGSGKSSVLAAVRSALRTAGVRSAHPTTARRRRSSDAAVVIDDAHLLDDGELEQLVDRVADPASTVVVATEPLAHRPALRALATAIERENPVVSIGALSPPDVTRLATEILGAAPTTEFVRALMVSTAGLPFLLQPAISAAASREGEAPAAAIAQAASFALIERLRRLDEPVLDTLLVTSLSPELGPDDVAATLRVGGAGRPVPGGPRTRQRIDRTFAQPHVPAFRASLRRSDHRDRATSRHRDRAARLPDRIFNAVSRSRSAIGRARTARRPAGQRAGRSCFHNHGQPARAARLYRAAADAGATTAQLAIGGCARPDR